MKDSNLMTVNKYVKGYNSNTREVIEPGFVDVQTTVDYDSSNFKYGSDYAGTDSYKDPLFFFQDPLLTTFDIILDTIHSPLFINGANSLDGFLQDYSEIYSIKARQKVHQEFKRIIYNLFNAEFKSIDRNKSYYINNITGLDNFTKRIVDFEKDKITINLNEDVSMISGYLAQLYNNLSYSYRDQRQMIPANLLRFNMYVKVHDVRNMPFYIPITPITKITSFDKSYQIYLLRDCTFDFRKSKNFENSITVGGFDAGAPITPSTISIDVVYKSIEVESEFPLIMDNISNPKSSALKINNKYKDIMARIDGLNTIFTNNAKSPENFDAEVSSNSELNNNGTSPLSINATKEDKDKAAKDNYKGDVVSSDIGTNKTRESDIKGVDPLNTDKKGNQVVSSDIETNKTRESDIKGVDPLNTDKKGNQVVPKDIIDKRNYEINVPYMFDPSVFGSNWNYGFDYTEPEMDSIRFNIMSQLNFNIVGFLFSLPFNIIKTFFGGYHGMHEIYIDTCAPNIPNMPNINVNKTPHIKELLTGTIDTTFDTKEPLTGTINTTLDAKEPLTGTIDTTFDTKEPLTGTIDTTFDAKEPLELLIGTINTTFDTKEPLTGTIDTTFNTKEPLELLTGTINTLFNPKIPLSGKINTDYKPKPLLFGYIDTTATPHSPVSGVIDTNFKLPRTINTTTPHPPPVSDVISTSFEPHPPVSGTIDTTSKTRGEIILGSLYTNSYKEKNVNLGLLYLDVTHENILPITYLYAKSEKFNSLVNYYVFNNAVSENKKLNNLSVDQTVITHKVAVVLDVMDSIRTKPDFTEIKLYNNTNFEKTLSLRHLYDKVKDNKVLGKEYLYDKPTERGEVELGLLYEPSKIKKILEQTILFEPKTKKILDLDKISGTFVKKDVNSLVKTENKNFDMVAEYDDKPVKKKLDEFRKDFDQSKAEQVIIEDNPLVKQYISEKEIKDNSLHGDIIDTGDYKKEKPGLDNERLR